MAHQAHNIPWNTLASHFQYAFESRKSGHRTNLVSRKSPQLGKQLEYFIKAFARTVREFSATQRAKYDPDLEVLPSFHERVIPGETEVIIRRSWEYSRTVSERNFCGCCCPAHPHYNPHDLPCACERTADTNVMGYWINFSRCAYCCKTFEYADFVNLTKTLLLHDQMSPLLRIAAHPETSLEQWYEFWPMPDSEKGWASVVRSALFPYVALNVLYLHPDTWPSSRPQQPQVPDEPVVDYRRTAMYQRAVRASTGSCTFDVQTLPHRRFFGIPHGALSPGDMEWDSDQLLVGRFPLKAQFEKNARGKHVPNAYDADNVASMLVNQGLPMELALNVLERADYKAQSRLKVPDDPMHPENAEELRKYLLYCWQLLVRCAVLAETCRQDLQNPVIDWEREVRHCIKRLFFAYDGSANIMKLVDVGDASEWRFA